MAVTVSNVLSGGGVPSGGTSISASWTPDGTSQYILTVSGYISSGSTVPAISSVTGNGLTWTQVAVTHGDNTGADRTSQYMFVAPAGGTTGGFTINWSLSAGKASWVLDKVAGADPSFGSGSLPQAPTTGTSSGANPSPTTPLGALLPGSVTYASADFESSAGTLSAGTGYTALGQDTSQALAWTISEWNSSGSTTATAVNSTTTNRHSIILIEIPTLIGGPMITGFQTADWTNTGSTKTITVTGALSGDEIVVFYGGDNGTTAAIVSAASVTTTSGSTSAWTTVEEDLAHSSQAWASSASASVTANGDVTLTLSRTQTTGQFWGGMALLAHNHGGVGVHANSSPSATETVSLAVSQDSAVGCLAIDWDALTPVAFSPSGATDVHRAFDTNLTNYAGYWRGQASGTRGYGIATSSTTNLHVIAIEILAAATGFTGTLTETQDNNTASASGVLGYTGIIGVTQDNNTSSASGTVASPITGVVSATQANNTSSISGVLSYSGTVAATQAGNTASASGVLGYSGILSRTQANNTATASGILGYSGTVARTQADNTSSASGVLGYSGTLAVVQAGNTATASGLVAGAGVAGSINVTQASNTSTASGVLGYSGTVAATEAGNTLTASGTSTPPGFSGSLAVTQQNNTASASGQLGYSGTIAETQANNTATASGVLSYTGTLARTQADNTLTASGLAGTGFIGSLNITQAGNTASASGVLGYAGTISTTQAGNISVASGKLGYGGTLTRTQANNTAVVAGLVANPVTGTLAIIQAGNKLTAAGVNQPLVLAGTASGGTGTAPTAVRGASAAPSGDGGSMAVAVASPGSMPVSTASGG